MMLGLSELEHGDAEETMFFSEFSCDAFKIMQNVRRQGKMCDVTLKVETSKFSAHRIVLAASIPYFNSMFTSDMVETNQNEIAIQGIEEHALESLVNFAYSGNVTVNVHNVQSILAGANFLQMEGVKNFCADFITKRLHPTNCLGVRQFGEVIMCSTLVDKANSFINRHFVDVCKCEEFLQLQKTSVLDILSRNELNVKNEEQVFHAVSAWIKYDYDARQKLMSDLLQHVRLPLLKPEFLTDVVQMDVAAKSCLKCRDLVDKAKDYHLIPDRRSTFPAHMICSRYCTEIQDLIFAVGGLTSTVEAISTVEKYVPNKTTWTTVASMATCRSRVGVAELGGKLYAVGGYDGTDRLDTIEVYDPEEDKWHSIKPMNKKRSALGCVSYDDCIFVCGGYDGVASLNSCEVYKPRLDEWQFISCMNKSRSAAAVGVFEGSLYILGGHDGLSIFSSVESYDRRQNKWSMGVPMLCKRCRHGVACLHGQMYVFGGYDGQKFLKTVEVFDGASKQWSYTTPMTMRRSRVGVTVSGGKIYALGGYDGCSNLRSVEAYDPESKLWSNSEPMCAHEGGVGIAGLSPFK